MTTYKSIEELSNIFNNDIETISNELKRIQSTKCRLKKQKFKSSYEKEMTEVLVYEENLKEVKQLLNPKEKSVTMYVQSDVDMLDYDQTVKAIRSIQSKKTLSKWLTDEECNNEEYKKAVEIETMLVEHRSKIKPVDEDNVRKTEILTIIETIQSSGNLSQEKILELLQNLI